MLTEPIRELCDQGVMLDRRNGWKVQGFSESSITHFAQFGFAMNGYPGLRVFWRHPSVSRHGSRRGVRGHIGDFGHDCVRGLGAKAGD